MEETKIITEELLNSLKTAKGAWTYKTLTSLGVHCPPKKGWKFRLIGSSLQTPTTPNIKAKKPQSFNRLQAGFRRRALAILNMNGNKVKNRDLFNMLARRFSICELPKTHFECITLFLSAMGDPPLLSTQIPIRIPAPVKIIYHSERESVPAKGNIKLFRKNVRTDSKHESFVKSDEFLQSYEWRRVRMEVLKRDGRKCACCGASPETGAVMNVDHIKPRKTHPELALDKNNLQVLCGDCNHGKGNWDSTDWRSSKIVDAQAPWGGLVGK